MLFNKKIDPELLLLKNQNIQIIVAKFTNCFLSLSYHRLFPPRYLDTVTLKSLGYV